MVRFTIIRILSSVLMYTKYILENKVIFCETKTINTKKYQKMKIKVWKIVVDTGVQKRSRPNLTDKPMAVRGERRKPGM